MKKTQILPFILFNLFVYRLVAYNSFERYVNSTSLYMGVTITGVILRNSGQITYIGMTQNSNNKIKKYNITSTQPQLLGVYTQNLSNIENQKFFFYKEFLISYTLKSTIIAIFNQKTFQLIANIDIGYVVESFKFSSNNKIIIFSTVTGQVCYIQQINFPFIQKSKINLLMNQFDQNAYISISPTQTYLSVSSKKSNSVSVYTMVPLKKIRVLTTSFEGVMAMTWNVSSDILYFAGINNNWLYQINATNNFSVTTTLILSGSNYITTIAHFQQTDQLVGVARVLDTTTTLKYFAYSIHTKRIMTQKRNYTSPITSVEFQEEKTMYFTTWRFGKVNFNKLLIDCPIGQYYSPCQRACISCTPQCTQCFAVGCNSCNSWNDGSNSTEDSAQDILNFTAIMHSNTTQLYSPQLQVIIDQYEKIVSFTFENKLFKILNKIPGGRKILTILFGFFTNLSDLWLYIFHQRSYNKVIWTLFQQINQMQMQKTQMFPVDKVFHAISGREHMQHQLFDFKQQFTSQKFKNVGSCSNGFLSNTPNILLSNILSTLTLFFVMKIVFKLCSRYQVSTLIKSYSYFPFLFISLVEGNLQYFSYLLAFDLKYFISENIYFKINNLVVILAVFVFFMFGGFFYLLIKIKSNTMAKQLFGNCKSNLTSTIYLTFSSGLKSNIIGILHYLFEEYYQIKISIIIGVQTLFIIYHMVTCSSYANKKSPVHYKFRIWTNFIFGSLVRIVLLFTFLSTYTGTNQDSLIQSQSYLYIHSVLIYCYTFLFLVSIVYEISMIVYELIKKLMPKKKRNTRQLSKQYEQRIRKFQKYKAFQSQQQQQQRSIQTYHQYSHHLEQNYNHSILLNQNLNNSINQGQISRNQISRNQSYRNYFCVDKVKYQNRKIGKLQKQNIFNKEENYENQNQNQKQKQNYYFSNNRHSYSSNSSGYSSNSSGYYSNSSSGYTSNTSEYSQNKHQQFRKQINRQHNMNKVKIKRTKSRFYQNRFIVRPNHS